MDDGCVLVAVPLNVRGAVSKIVPKNFAELFFQNEAQTKHDNAKNGGEFYVGKNAGRSTIFCLPNTMQNLYGPVLKLPAPDGKKC